MGKNLRRELGFWDAVATGITAMIGAGIFVISGIGARAAGSAVILAFIIAGVVALFNALSSAELAAVIPLEGGTYEYARRLISPKVGFATGWLFILSKMLESATVASAFGSYASLFLHVESRMLNSNCGNSVNRSKCCRHRVLNRCRSSWKPAFRGDGLVCSLCRNS